jgi:hypothetical protein
LIQSDGIISPDLVADLAAGEINPVSLFIATNNAQIVPAGASGTYDNLLPIGKPENEGPFGLRVFHEILCRVTDELGYLPHLAFCGGGYLQSPSKHGPFLLSDADQLKQSFSALALGQKVHCPHPGDTYALLKSLQGIHVETEHAPWIVRGECLFTAEVVNRDWFSNSIFPSFATNEDRVNAIRDIEQELKMMAPNLLCSDFGRCVTACNAYINGPTMPYRFAIRLYEIQTGHIMTAILDINNCRFDWKDTEEDAVIQNIPFGIDVHLVDFYELLQGGLQIWELATAKMRQWYVGEDKMRSPVAFLYSYFSEQVRPDLAANMYARIAMDETVEA